jgi:hypothetical protein
LRRIEGDRREVGLEGRAQAQDRFQVVIAGHVQRARHPRTREAHLAGGVEDMGDRDRVPDLDDGRSAVEDAAVPEAQGHRQRVDPHAGKRIPHRARDLWASANTS